MSYIDFLFGDQPGFVEVSDIKVYLGSAERWLRYYEGGVAVVNKTNHIWNIELDERMAPYKRICLIFADYNKHDKGINSGEHGHGPRKNLFSIPAQDSLFIIRCAGTPDPSCGIQQKDYYHANDINWEDMSLKGVP